MCVRISHLFPPLHLNYSAFPITRFYPNIPFPLPPLLWARGTPQRRAMPAPSSPTGDTSETSMKNPPHRLLAEELTLPRPTERLMHLQTEIRCLNLKPQSSKAALNLSGHDCRQFCLIKLGWRQTHPCLRILFLPMPPWARTHTPAKHRELYAASPCSQEYYEILDKMKNKIQIAPKAKLGIQESPLQLTGDLLDSSFLFSTWLWEQRLQDTVWMSNCSPSVQNKSLFWDGKLWFLKRQTSLLACFIKLAKENLIQIKKHIQTDPLEKNNWYLCAVATLHSLQGLTFCKTHLLNLTKLIIYDLLTTMTSFQELAHIPLWESNL